MTSIGEQLQRQRLQRGIDLEQIARETKISSRLLEAIEADQFDRLPGGVFRKSFVRQYAQALGVDESDIAAELEQLVPVEEPVEPAIRESERLQPAMPAMPTQADALDRRWLAASAGSFLSVLAVIVACALLYSWWQNLNRPPAAADPAPISSAAPAKSAGDAKPNLPPSISDSGETVTGAAEPAAGTPEAATGPGTTAPQAQPGAYTPAAPGLFRVDLSATEPVWISAVVDGRRVFMGTLNASDAKILEGAQRVRIRAGNAGGLGVSLNGKPIGELGPRGQIREIELTPQGAQVFEPAPDPEAEEPVRPRRPTPAVKPVEEIPEAFLRNSVSARLGLAERGQFAAPFNQQKFATPA
jgi:cytoskeleton protein RodZ